MTVTDYIDEIEQDPYWATAQEAEELDNIIDEYEE